MSNPANAADFEALDSCHQQTLEMLRALGALAEHMEDEPLDGKAREKARAIDKFFTHTSHAHHTDEESTVFPALLASKDEALVQAVRSLQQDHGWIERNWTVLGPQLRAIALGEAGPDPQEFREGVRIFTELLHNHIALEETLIYPESRARWAQIVERRKLPLPG